MTTPDDLRQEIVERLRAVIDPETGMDVVHMRLVEDVQVDEAGRVSYRFRPSSPLCPIAVPLALEILNCVAAVPGVAGQQPTVVGHVLAAEINQLLMAQRQERSAGDAERPRPDEG